ncbi:hemerythrin domain-containing protein [Alicyclobacillus ferrooxydans]|uniref:Hemerythrin-like domain-containing protein n=1 Tax=Alicyclobacillus ferrooxydans TaxID=471514 RepID=A0A0P9EYN0_9BACL|nr:hemerythrin domain-containing protein [Alicyclobacillus ferrooxydans]KPV44241.1 hypothetical protein AN477_08035 [Alicyclobacillus ferrooxydans]
MSGPALRQANAHYAIHESAYGEAEELLTLLQRVIQLGEWEQGMQVADVLAEHFEARTLAHAHEEENGLYQEIVAEHPELSVVIATLTHDHDLMRQLVDEVRALLQSTGTDTEDVLEQAVNRFVTLMWINQNHSRAEEKMVGSL